MSDIKAAATVLTDSVRTAMKRAYNLGQTYLQQADSEYRSENKKADVTATRFMELTDAICAKVDALAHAGKAVAEEAPAVADIEGLTRYTKRTDSMGGAAWMEATYDGEWLKRADVERLLAHASVTAEPSLAIDGWMVDGSLIYRLNDKGVNCDEINVTMVNGSRANDARHDAAIELLTELTSIYQVPAAEVRVAALEEAALVCEEYAMQWHQEPSSRASGKKAGGFDCAAAIRALKGQSTADKASEVRAAEEGGAA